MMGFGTYGYGGSYLSSSSSSSLSALAPPFTVERPVPKPISGPPPQVESYDGPPNASVNNLVPPHSHSSVPDFFANPPPAFNYMPSSDAYRYAGLPTFDSFSTNIPPMNTVSAPLSDAFTYQGLDVSASSFVEAKPYYPSYLSPTIHGDSPMVAPEQPSYDWLSTSQFAPLDGSSRKEYTQRPSSSKYKAQWGSSWNRPAEWDEGEHGQFDGSFGQKESDVSNFPYKNFLNQDTQSSNSFKSYGVNEVASHNIPDWNGPVNADHIRDKSYVGRNSEFNPIDFTKPTMGSLSMVPEFPSEVPSSPFVMKSAYGVSNEKGQHDASWKDITSISKSSPASIIRPPAIGTKRLNSGRDLVDAYHRGYYPSQESHIPQSSVDTLPSDSNKLDIHLGRTDPFFVESSTTKGTAAPNSGSMYNDPLDHLFKVKSQHPSSHVNPDGFDEAVNFNDSINSFLNSSENMEPNNPPVDSPCWKGVPGSSFSPFKASEEGGSEKTKKPEGCNDLNLNVPMSFSLNKSENISTRKPVEYNELGWLGNGLPRPLKKLSVANSASGEHKSDDTKKTTYYQESSHDRELQGCISTSHSRSGDKSSSVFEHTDIVQECRGEDGLSTEWKNATWSFGSDLKLNVNDTLEYGSSHTSPIQNTFSSPSVEDTKVATSNMNMDVPILINRMGSLSQSLLVNCLNSSSQLKEEDIDSLKAVINNLNSCILKHDEDSLSMPESPHLQQSTIKYIEDLCKSNKVSSQEMPQLTKIFAPSIQDSLHLQGFQKVKNPDRFFENGDEVIGSVSAKSDIDLLKQEEMTQNIKKILCENFQTEDTHPQTLFYKNLWLEAEAVICSTNYKARFNRMKTEMEKCKADPSKDVFEHTADMMTQLRSEVCANSNLVEKSTPEVQDCSLPKLSLQHSPTLNQGNDDVMSRFHILRNRIENTSSVNATDGDESSSSLSLVPDEVAPEADTGLSPRISIQESPTSSITCMTNDYEASVMARFHLIRDRVENSEVISDANVENITSSKVCHEQEAEEVAHETSDNGSIQVFLEDCAGSGQRYPVSTSTNISHANQYEDPILVRFNILKSRADNFTDMHTVGGLLESVDFGYAGKRNRGPIIGNRSEVGSSHGTEQQADFQSCTADNSKGKCMEAKEFRLFVEDGPGHMINMPTKQLSAGSPDRSTSSDWEHVMKEDVWGHSY